MQVTIANDEGEVWAVVRRQRVTDDKVHWVIDDMSNEGEVVAESDREFTGGSSLATVHDLITDAIRWEQLNSGDRARSV